MENTNLQSFRGDNYSRVIVFTDADGNAKDITGWTLFFTLKIGKEATAVITGNQATFTGQADDKIKVIIDSVTYDDIDVSVCTTIDAVAAAINLATGGTQATKSPGGNLVITSPTAGAASTCTIADGSGTGQTVIAELFSVTADRTNSEGSVMEKDWTDHSAPTEGKTTFELSAEETKDLVDSYWYDFQYKDRDGNVKTFLLGNFDFAEDITRRTS